MTGRAYTFNNIEFITVSSLKVIDCIWSEAMVSRQSLFVFQFIHNTTLNTFWPFDRVSLNLF